MPHVAHVVTNFLNPNNVDVLPWPAMPPDLSPIWEIITKTHLFKYIENFTTKNWKFSDKNSDIFHNSAQNIDCRHSLEPPSWGGSDEYPQSMFLSRKEK